MSYEFPDFGDPIPTTHGQLAPPNFLCLANLEVWMDESFVMSLCKLKGWNDVQVRIQQAAPDLATGQTFLNPGYCILIFPSGAAASAAISQVMQGPGGPTTMPNCSVPFHLTRWNPVTHPASFLPPQHIHPPSSMPPAQPEEFSIFVGDLASDVSNSDLVNVFRNPQSGLQADREPRVIKPFASCKSAKIQLDPITGLSKGYGFVRFTNQEEMKRALIEMPGLYCLSRPMRISPATAKSRGNHHGGSPYSASSPSTNGPSMPAPNEAARHQKEYKHEPIVLSRAPLYFPVPQLAPQPQLDETAISQTLAQINKLAEQPPRREAPENASVTTLLARSIRPAPFYNSTTVPNFAAEQQSGVPQQQRAQHILGRLLGPQGEQITSQDPYNTTVFVGGLSPLISEETLRSFFEPFGAIHYVRVPAGKHCGFVQYVRKAEAENAMEKMQGFVLAGSKIRLSWGRSQYKAIQAAASLTSPSSPSPTASVSPSPFVSPVTMNGQQKPETSQHPASVTANGSSGSMSPADAERMAQFLARNAGLTPDQADLLLALGASEDTVNMALLRGQSSASAMASTPPLYATGNASNMSHGNGGVLPSSLYGAMDSMPEPFPVEPTMPIPSLQSPINHPFPQPIDYRAQPVSPFAQYNMNGVSGTPASFMPFYDDRHSSRPGAFNANDLLRKDTQAMPRNLRGSAPMQSAATQSSLFSAAGTIGNKPTLDSINAGLSSLTFGNQIWSLPSSVRHSTKRTSPTLPHPRKAGDPNGSAGGDGN
ncbi:hypothetical protein BKA62DRAFT_829321 [Auriculariales sp. MPI-PUGE-AT-0066]|nr:hypothetical protein BKA62DRAFT_829321 [Auriculariales sp. MPI-PUGE-AT-0066]